MGESRQPTRKCIRGITKQKTPTCRNRGISIKMNCPVCKSSKLTSKELDKSLTSLNCSVCDGNWISGVEYWHWLEEHGANLPERDADTSSLEGQDTTDPLDCPECRWRMVKYMVGHGEDFSLDQCHGCRGLWLDKGEWERLQAKNLHDGLHGMLTSFWQNEARRDTTRRRAERRYVQKF